MKGWRPVFDQLPVQYDQATFQANQDSLKNILPDFMGGRQIAVRYGQASVHFAGTGAANSGPFPHGLDGAPVVAIPGVLGAGNEILNAAISTSATQLVVYLKTIDGSTLSGDVAVSWLVIG